MHKLENDPMCGKTTGGQDECTWDCKIVFSVATNPSIFNSVIKIQNPECLKDCFEDLPCVKMLLENLVYAEIVV